METKSCEKVATKFYCITCDYYTSRKSSYDKHIITLKHSELTKGNNKVAKSCAPDNDNEFLCNFCDKLFKSRVGIWKHKKICSSKQSTNNEETMNNSLDKELIMMLIKENSEFKNMIIKVLEHGTNNTSLFIVLIPKEKHYILKMIMNG